MTFAQHQPDSGPDAYFRDIVAGSLRHVEDVSQLLEDHPPRWTDALLSEVRAHLSGCLNSVEAEVLGELDGNWIARPVAALGSGYCRLAIERHPALLSPILLDHFRLRAAAAIAFRMMVAPMRVAGFGQATQDTTTHQGPISEALAAFRQSADPWLAPHPLDRAMRADLPAEPFCDLAWTASALLVEGLTTRMGIEPGAAMAGLARVTETIIARHDEQAGPFARAAYLATLVREESDVRHFAEQGAMDHDLLLLAALSADRLGIPLEQAMSLLVDGVTEERAALAHILGLGDVAFVAVLDALAPISDAVDDSQLPDVVAQFRSLTAEEASRLLGRWRGPGPLVSKLSRIGWTRK